MKLFEYYDKVNKIIRKAYISTNIEEGERRISDWYKIIIKSSDMVICSFTTSNYDEACEIARIAHKMRYDVEWRF